MITSKAVSHREHRPKEKGLQQFHNNKIVIYGPSETSLGKTFF
jgi:hypothetical protein